MLKTIILIICAGACLAKHEVASLIDFDLKCSLEKGEEGSYAILSKCPATLDKVKLGGKFPKVCDAKEVCWDVVCCPGRTGYGSKFDVLDRLKNGSCIVPETEIKGTYIHQQYCPSLIDEKISREPVCPFTICENIVCCPANTTEIVEKAAKVDFYQETCVFDKTFDGGREFKRGNKERCDIEGEDTGGYCSPYFQCEAYNFNSYDYEKDTFSRNVTLCGYNCCVPIVCCPHTYKKRTPLTPSSFCNPPSKYWRYQFLTEQKHLDSKRSLTCSDNSTIVESTRKLESKENERLYAVQLGYFSESKWDCEGVMLNSDTILTTATCLDFSKKGPVFAVRVGETEYQVKKIYKHQLYKPNLIYHDIGIVKTMTSIELPDKYQITCLPQSRDVLHQERLFAGNADSPIKSEIKIVGMSKCKQAVSKFKKGELKYGILDEIQFCAGLLDVNSTDCPLTLVGSPLISKNGFVVGLNELERECGKEQIGSLFESIYPYVRWIEKYLKIQ